MDAGAGTLGWRVPLNTRLGRHVTTPVVVDDLVIVGSYQLVLFAAHPARFEEIGRTQACGVTWCAPAYADGNLYARDTKTLACLDLAP